MKFTIITTKEEEKEFNLPIYVKYSSTSIIRIETDESATEVCVHSPDNFLMIRWTLKGKISNLINLPEATVEEWYHAVALFKRYSDDFLKEEYTCNAWKGKEEMSL